MINILITHVYSSNNKGDAAILSAQLNELRRVYKNPVFNILTVDTVSKNYKFDGVPVHNALMYDAVAPTGNHLTKFILASAMMLYTFAWSLNYRLFKVALPIPKRWKMALYLMQSSDIQIGVGGGYFRAKNDFSSTFILILLFHQILIAKILRKPVYLYAQSFGPFPKWIQRQIASFSLKKVDLILVREEKSKKLLERLGLEKKVILIPDSAFLFSIPKGQVLFKKILKDKSSETIGITVRAWLDDSGQKRYEKAMVKFIDYVSDNNKRFKVILIPQVTSRLQNDDDRLVGGRIKSQLKHPEKVTFLDGRLNHYDVRAIIGNLNYMIGTRFHSVIFALSSGVPAIGIEYEHKTSGIMNGLGLSDWVIKIEDVTAQKLIKLFEKLQKQRGSYLKQLNTQIPGYKQRASTGAMLIKQAYEREYLQRESSEK